MSIRISSDPETDAGETNFHSFDSWEAAMAYAEEVVEGPVTVKIVGEPTIYRMTADGRKRALCRMT